MFPVCRATSAPTRLSSRPPVLPRGPQPPTDGRNPVIPSKKTKKCLNKLSPRTESQPAGRIKKSDQVKCLEMWAQKATKAGYEMLVACSPPAWPSSGGFRAWLSSNGLACQVTWLNGRRSKQAEIFRNQPQLLAEITLTNTAPAKGTTLS